MLRHNLEGRCISPPNLPIRSFDQGYYMPRAFIAFCNYDGTSGLTRFPFVYDGISSVLCLEPCWGKRLACLLNNDRQDACPTNAS
jgi:hypothetical protein